MPTQTGVLPSAKAGYLLNIDGGVDRDKALEENRFIMPTFIIFAILFIIAAFTSGCNTVASTSANNTAPPANTAAKNEDPKPADPKPTESAPADPSTVGSLTTPIEAYKTAYDLRKKKDVAGLKAMMSSDIKEFLTMMGEEDKPKKSLDDMIKEMCDKPQADRADTRNEKIKGDTATVEYLTEKGDWKTMDFERVGGKWFLSFPKAEPGETMNK
ncbi:MAG: hypothetical protein ABIR33_04440 [Pyrinomonadaceae bacterium]